AQASSGTADGSRRARSASSTPATMLPIARAISTLMSSPPNGIGTSGAITSSSAPTAPAAATPTCSARTRPAAATRKPTIATSATASITTAESTTSTEEVTKDRPAPICPGSPRPISAHAAIPTAAEKAVPSSSTITSTAAAIAPSRPSTSTTPPTPPSAPKGPATASATARSTPSSRPMPMARPARLQARRGPVMIAAARGKASGTASSTAVRALETSSAGSRSNDMLHGLPLDTVGASGSPNRNVAAARSGGRRAVRQGAARQQPRHLVGEPHRGAGLLQQRQRRAGEIDAQLVGAMFEHRERRGVGLAGCGIVPGHDREVLWHPQTGGEDPAGAGDGHRVVVIDDHGGALRAVQQGLGGRGAAVG